MALKATIVAASVFVLSLAGCGASEAPATAPSVSTTTTTTATPPATMSYATKEQVASVVGGGEKIWREAAKKSGECRLKYVMKEDDPLEKVERLTCYTNELTATTQAQIAIRDLGELSVPPSMQDLVDETLSALQMFVDADLESVCGPAMTEPKDTKACTEAMGTQNWAYTRISSVLDKWAPYL